jgi:hypothetical protein
MPLYRAHFSRNFRLSVAALRFTSPTPTKTSGEDNGFVHARSKETRTQKQISDLMRIYIEQGFTSGASVLTSNINEWYTMLPLTVLNSRCQRRKTIMHHVKFYSSD